MRALRVAATAALAGALTFAPVSIASAAEGAWDPVVTVSSAVGMTQDARVVTDGTTITAVWGYSDFVSLLIVSSYSTDKGLTWSTPTEVANVPRGINGLEVITVGGVVTAMWSSPDVFNYGHIFVSSSADGGANWTPPAQLTSDWIDSYQQRVVSDGTRITAFWQSRVGVVSVVQSRFSDDGGVSWGPPSTCMGPM